MSPRTDARRRYDRDHAAVLALWQAWDPIGAGEVADEYSSHVPQVLRLLYAGADEAQLARHLEQELRTHFGLEPRGHEEFARRVMSWWSSRSSAVNRD